MEILSYVILGLFILGLIGYVVYMIKKEGLVNVAIELIFQAEMYYEKGMNTEKKQFVVNAIKSLLPAAIKPFITVDALDKFAQGVFNTVKPIMDNSVDNNSK